jgi:hypothetical protein
MMINEHLKRRHKAEHGSAARDLYDTHADLSALGTPGFRAKPQRGRSRGISKGRQSLGHIALS